MPMQWYSDSLVGGKGSRLGGTDEEKTWPPTTNHQGLICHSQGRASTLKTRQKLNDEELLAME